MKRIPLTRGRFALVDDEDFEMLSRFKWQCSYQGYAKCKLPGRRTDPYVGVLMHRMILSPIPDGMLVDHIDGDGLNNTRANIRLATNSQNCQNTRSQNMVKDGEYKGVDFHYANKLWRARICKDRIRHNLGYFRYKIDAALAYDAKARELFGEFARCNYPDES